MFIALHKRLGEREEGFTLIELLVVVIIIGILAAIAIPSFLNQRERAWEAASVSTLRNAAVAEETLFSTSSAYATADAAGETALEGQGFNQTTNVNFVVVRGGTTGFCLVANHTAGGRAYRFASETGQAEPFATVALASATPCA